MVMVNLVYHVFGLKISATTMICIILLLGQYFHVVNSVQFLETIEYSSAASFTWTSNGVVFVEVTMCGGRGGNDNSVSGGKGAEVTASFNVNPGTTWTITVAGDGSSRDGGYNGGGRGGSEAGAGGGGMTDISVDGLKIAIAGGGGGGYYYSSGCTGSGGNAGLTGTSGSGSSCACTYVGGGGASGLGGGTCTPKTCVLQSFSCTAGSQYTGGDSDSGDGAGGGAGYYGGGGSAGGGGGGGGSSYVHSSAVSSSFKTCTQGPSFTMHTYISEPTSVPTSTPTSRPSAIPSSKPTAQPTGWPSTQPSSFPSVMPSNQPSTEPSVPPTDQPTSVPSTTPTVQPSSRPSSTPSGLPSMQPTAQPTIQPSCEPTAQPSNRPSAQPTGRPSTHPSSLPSVMPSNQPSTEPSVPPTDQPTSVPSTTPTVQPSSRPSSTPSGLPSMQPTAQPTIQPSCEPTAQPSNRPSAQPLSEPSLQPSSQPSTFPSRSPSVQPTSQPSCGPSIQPSSEPTRIPSVRPTGQPSRAPSIQPSRVPSAQPTSYPSIQPSVSPSRQPSRQPSSQPSRLPSVQPSSQPSQLPTHQPSTQPSSCPSTKPSHVPTYQPSSVPSSQPSASPSVQPSDSPSGQPTRIPSNQPTARPSSQPSRWPTSQPSEFPSCKPSVQPSTQPTRQPSCQPSHQPSRLPTVPPSVQPSASPTCSPSSGPTMQPSNGPTARPTAQPSRRPSRLPTSFPSSQPLSSPTGQPSAQPSVEPTRQPSAQPSAQPSIQPSVNPSGKPSRYPSVVPTTQPNGQPSSGPTSQPSSQPSYYITLSGQVDTTQWMGVLEETIAKELVVPGAHFSKTSQYYELFRARNATVDYYVGGCSTWSSLLYGDMRSVQYRPTSLQLGSVELRQVAPDSSSDFAHLNAICSDKTQVSAIFNLLTLEKAKQATHLPAVVHCDGRNWSLAVCPSSTLSAPSLCVDCTDPCVANLHCTSPSSSVSSAASLLPLTLSPCSGAELVSPFCQSYDGFSLQPVTAVHTLLVGYEGLLPPPEIKNVFASAQTTSITVLLNISNAVEVYCAAFTEAEASALLESPDNIVDKIHLESPGSTAAVLGIAVALIEDLKPLTKYSIFCLAKSSVGLTNPVSEIISWHKNFTTLCCKTVAVSQVRSVITELTQDGLDFFELRLNALPLEKLTMHVRLHNSTGYLMKNTSTVPSLLTVSAISSSSASALTTYSVSVQTTLLPGPYAYEVVLSGPSAWEYWVTYPVSRLELPLSSSEIGTGTGAADNAISCTTSTCGTFYLQSIGESINVTAPKLQSAIFSSDGTFFRIYFDTVTDKGGTDAIFPCDELFDFDCAETSTCKWFDKSTVLAFVHGYSSSSALLCATPGSTLSLGLSAAIKWYCDPSIFTPAECMELPLEWPTTAVNRSLVIENPENAQSPFVSISSPELIQSCDDLILDLSSSYGSGGRDWSYVHVTAQSVSENITFLQQFLDSNEFNLMPPTPIPSSYLNVGSYVFLVTLCNFLGRCNDGSRAISVLDAAIPNVRIIGSAVRTAHRWSALSLSTTSYISSCSSSSSTTTIPSSGNNASPLITSSASSSSSSSSTAGLTYSWTVLKNSKPVFELVSTSKDVTKFYAAAFSLDVNSIYEISFRATVESTLISATSSLIVYITPGDIVAVISGPSSVTLRYLEQIDLSAGDSYDEDNLNDSRSGSGIANSAALSFKWQCITTAPILSDVCSVTLVSGSGSSSGGGEGEGEGEGGNGFSTATLSALSASSTGSTNKITLTVSDANSVTDTRTIRSASASVTVQVLPAIAAIAVVSVSSVRSTKVVNLGQNIQLKGQINVPMSIFNSAGRATVPATLWWSADQAGTALDISVGARSATSMQLNLALAQAATTSASTGTATFFTYFVYAASGFQTKSSTVTFTLSCSLSAQSASIYSSSLGITINTPPLPGLFAVDPQEGTELKDLFTFTASFWVDIDLPLTYQFGYISAGGDSVTVVQSQSEKSYGSALLPAIGVSSSSSKWSKASSSSGSSVTLRAQIFDVLEATSTSTASVTVHKGPTLSLSDVANFVYAANAGPESVDQAKNAAALSNFLLNSVNCSQAPDCALLNRKDCLNTAHTCGSCLSYVDYVGADGDANSPCSPSGAARRLLFGAAGGESEELEGWPRGAVVQSVTGSSTRSNTIILPLGSICDVESNVSVCADLAECDKQSSLCVLVDKSCVSDCTGGIGSCTFFDDFTGKVVSKCPLSATDCHAKCICPVNFTRSSSCEMADNDMRIKQDARSAVLNSLTLLTTTEDPTRESIADLITLLSAATQRPDELSATDVQKVWELCLYIFEHIDSVKLSNDRFVGLLRVVDALTRRIPNLLDDGDDDSTLASIGGSSTSYYNITTSLLGLDRLSALLAANMLPGEFAQQNIYDSFRMSVSVHSAGDASSSTSNDGNILAALAANTTAEKAMTSISLPQRSLESAFNGAVQGTEIHFAMNDASTGGFVRAQIVQVAAPFLNISSAASSSSSLSLLPSSPVSSSAALVAHPLSVSFSEPPCSSSSGMCQVRFRQPRKLKVSGILQTFNITCREENSTYSKWFYCEEGGAAVHLACNGTLGRITAECPYTEYFDTCSVLNEDSTASSAFITNNTSSPSRECRVISNSTDLTYVTTEVRWNVSSYGDDSQRHAQSQAQRRLDGVNISSSNNGDDESNSGGADFTYVSMMDSVAYSFTTTVVSAKDLNKGVLAKQWIVLVTIGSIAISAIVSIFLAQRADEQESGERDTDRLQKQKRMDQIKEKRKLQRSGRQQQQQQQQQRSESGSLRRFSLAALSSSGGRSDVKLEMSTAQLIVKTKREVKWAENRKLAKQRASFGRDLALIEESLPHVLRSDSVLNKCSAELKNHHRWLSVVFFYSETFSRAARIASLVTNVMIMLFIQSLTYNLTNPDDGECELFTDKIECLEPKSPYNTGEAKCRWETIDRGVYYTNQCSFVEADSSVKLILFVAAFSAVITTPLALLGDVLIRSHFAAPNKDSNILSQSQHSTQQRRGTDNGLAVTGVKGSSSSSRDNDSRVSVLPPLSVSEVNSMVPIAIDCSDPITVSGSVGKRRAPVRIAPQPQTEEVDSRRGGGGDGGGGGRRRSSVAAFLSTALSPLFNNKKKNRGTVITPAILKEFHEFSTKLRLYRDTLDAKLRRELDEVWGLSSDGSFVEKGSNKGMLSRFLLLFTGGDLASNVAQEVLNDLTEVTYNLEDELAFFSDIGSSNGNRSPEETKALKKRLLFLFQCDLLPGVTGKILASKSARDAAVKIKHREHSSAKRAFVLGSLILLNAAMLFYILLFAIAQSEAQQSAWFRSFILWVVMEIFIVSTLSVIIIHVVVPYFALHNVNKIKARTMNIIAQFYEQAKSNDCAVTAVNREQSQISSPQEQTQQLHLAVIASTAGEEENRDSVTAVDSAPTPTVLNAASYFFLSTRLAKHFPDLQESKIIASFSTPWPKRSYVYVEKATSSAYASKYRAVLKSANIVIMFFIGSLLTVPPHIQDLLIQMATTSSVGYIAFVHLVLYDMSPALAVAPTLLLAVVIYSIIFGGRPRASVVLPKIKIEGGKGAEGNMPPRSKSSSVSSGGKVKESYNNKATESQSQSTGSAVIPSLTPLSRFPLSSGGGLANTPLSPSPTVSMHHHHHHHQRHCSGAARRSSIAHGITLLEAAARSTNQSDIAPATAGTNSDSDSDGGASSDSDRDRDTADRGGERCVSRPHYYDALLSSNVAPDISPDTSENENEQQGEGDNISSSSSNSNGSSGSSAVSGNFKYSHNIVTSSSRINVEKEEEEEAESDELCSEDSAYWSDISSFSNN